MKEPIYRFEGGGACLIDPAPFVSEFGDQLRQRGLGQMRWHEEPAPVTATNSICLRADVPIVPPTNSTAIEYAIGAFQDCVNRRGGIGPEATFQIGVRLTIKLRVTIDYSEVDQLRESLKRLMAASSQFLTTDSNDSRVASISGDKTSMQEIKSAKIQPVQDSRPAVSKPASAKLVDRVAAMSQKYGHNFDDVDPSEFVRELRADQ